jgi:DNA polymerase-3 subunit alpha
MAATLSRNLNDIDELTKLMDECKRMKISVLGPDINESQNSFAVNSSGDIRFGLAGIKGVGGAAVDSIVMARGDKPFISIFDFIERINFNSVNKKCIESLIFAGAFDGVDIYKREQYLAKNSKDEFFIESLLKYGNTYHNDSLNGSNSLFGDSESIKLVVPEVPKVDDVDTLEMLKREKELVGMYLSAHPLDRFSFEVKSLTSATLSEASDMVVEAPNRADYRGKELVLAGIITSVKIAYTKNGKPFAVFTIEDFNGAISFTLYGKDYEAYMQYLQINTPLLLKTQINPKYGYASKDGDEKVLDYELKIRGIRHLANAKDEFIKEITVDLPINIIDEKFRKELLNTLKKTKGSASLNIKCIDFQNRLTVEFVSLKYRVSICEQLLDFFSSNNIKYSIVPSLSF